MVRVYIFCVRIRPIRISYRTQTATRLRPTKDYKLGRPTHAELLPDECNIGRYLCPTAYARLQTKINKNNYRTVYTAPGVRVVALSSAVRAGSGPIKCVTNDDAN